MKFTTEGVARRGRRSVLAGVGAMLLLVTTFGAAAVPVAADPPPDAAPSEMASQTVVVDGAQTGRPFAGIGGLSATSKLLFDYPEPQRGEILDYLFTPGYGAELSVLKVPIGGDTFGGIGGADPTHMRIRGEVNCERGHVWWLMEQAKDRNPAIELSALPWAIPGWFDGGLWSTDHVDYLVEWLDCAQQRGLEIDALGGLNESPAEPEVYVPFYLELKETLVAAGYGDVRLVCCDHATNFDDNEWKAAQAVADDPDFARVVDIIGVHSPIPCRFGGSCANPPEARDSGKELRITEQAMGGGQPDADHARHRAQQYNRMYIEGRITGADIWPMTTGFYTDGRADGTFVLNNRPWSGQYEVKSSVWVTAHTNQFADPGWRYVDDASRELDAGGSIVTLRAPDPRDPDEAADYSVVA